jgi:hypothetical protein
VGAAAGDNIFLDWRPADQAGLAGALVDLVLELEEAADAVGVDVVGDGGAAELDGMAQDFDEGGAQSREFGTREAGGMAAGRMPARKSDSSA